MKEKKAKKVACYANVGGQALVGGIMMRTPERQAIVVRLPNDDLYVENTPVSSVKDKYPILKWPVLRGIAGFIESMAGGYKDMLKSIELTMVDDDEDEKPQKPSKFQEKYGASIMNGAMWLGTVLGIVLAIFLLFFLPTWIVKTIDKSFPLGGFKGIIEGLLKLVVFFLYTFAISRMKEIKEVFMYHGAEHKSIFCYEKGLPLTVENVKAQSRFHPRCGTSFIIIMVLVSIIVFAFISWSNIYIRVLLKLLALPFVLGIGYEVLRFCGKHDNWLTKILSAPGLWFQRLTTAEPNDDGIIEVGIASLQSALGIEITVPLTKTLAFVPEQESVTESEASADESSEASAEEPNAHSVSDEVAPEGDDSTQAFQTVTDSDAV